MKKILSILLICLALCSCSSAKSIVPRLSGISFTADMTYYNEVYAFDGEILSDGTMKATVTSPEELSELEFTLTGEGTTVNYKGLTYSPVEGSMPFSKIMEDIYLPIREVALGDATADGNGILTGGEGSGEYSFTLSPTGLPQKLEMPDERFFVKFYNVSVKEDVND